MALLTWWTRIWARSWSFLWKEKPRVLQSMWSQKVRKHWVTEQQNGLCQVLHIDSKGFFFVFFFFSLYTFHQNWELEKVRFQGNINMKKYSKGWFLESAPSSFTKILRPILLLYMERDLDQEQSKDRSTPWKPFLSNLRGTFSTFKTQFKLFLLRAFSLFSSRQI